MDIVAKTRQDYNKIASHYAQTRPHVWAELLQFKAFLANGQRILDWGCGHGRLIELFDGFTVEYFGVDQSSGQLRIAKEKYKKQIDAGSVHFINNARGEKKFSENYFDLVFMVASLFHLPTPELRLALLKKSYHDLKPGGRIIITAWNLKSAWSQRKSKGWKKLSPNDFLIPWKDPSGKTMVERYYHNFTPTELKKLLKAAGFTVERMEFMSDAQSSDSKGGRNLVAVALKK